MEYLFFWRRRPADHRAILPEHEYDQQPAPEASPEPVLLVGLQDFDPLPLV